MEFKVIMNLLPPSTKHIYSLVMIIGHYNEINHGDTVFSCLVQQLQKLWLVQSNILGNVLASDRLSEQSFTENT